MGLKMIVFGTDRHDLLTIRKPGDDAIETWRTWQHIVEEFSSRQLTYPMDRLPALSGLANIMPFPEADSCQALATDPSG